MRDVKALWNISCYWCYGVWHTVDQELQFQKWRISLESRRVRCSFGVWTDRVLCALIKHEQRFVWWPTATERASVREEMRFEKGLSGCAGFIDGTHINFYTAPARKDAPDYFNRHKQYSYSYNVLAVVDNRKRFRLVHVGLSGSAHDQRVFRSSRLSRDPEAFFSKNEYVLADAGYTPGAHIVPLYKRVRG
ncbi:unnamed protein product, partial [Tilletia controversa]